MPNARSRNESFATSWAIRAMFDLPLVADIGRLHWNVRFVLPTGWTQHFILEGKDGVYSDGSPIVLQRQRTEL